MGFIKEFMRSIGFKTPSMARRINYKINTMVKKFGYDSVITQDLMSNIITTVPPENIVYKDGVPQIRKPINLAKKGIDLSDLDRMKGYGDYKREYEKSYEQYKFDVEFETEKPLPIETFISKMYSVDEIMDKVKFVSSFGASGDSENLALDIMRNPIKTYTDLFRVGDLLGVV